MLPQNLFPQVPIYPPLPPTDPYDFTSSKRRRPWLGVFESKYARQKILNESNYSPVDYSAYSLKQLAYVAVLRNPQLIQIPIHWKPALIGETRTFNTQKRQPRKFRCRSMEIKTCIRSVMDPQERAFMHRRLGWPHSQMFIRIDNDNLEFLEQEKLAIVKSVSYVHWAEEASKSGLCLGKAFALFNKERGYYYLDSDSEEVSDGEIEDFIENYFDGQLTHSHK